MKTVLITSEHTYQYLNNHPVLQLNPTVVWEHELDSFQDASGEAMLLIDTEFDQSPERLEWYSSFPPQSIILVSSVYEPLLTIFNDYVGIQPTQTKNIFGFNGLPGFIQRPLWEVSALYPQNFEFLQKSLAPAGLEVRLVADRIGLVAARTVCLIINEAFLMLQEGASNEQDIDTAMKLGVNYPYGPFEWLNLIGIHHVYNILNNLKKQYGAEKVKISDLLYERYSRTFWQ